MKQVPPRLFAPATLSLGCLIYAALALVALHILRPDLTPRTNFISNYAVGPYGWVMTSCFCAMSLGVTLLAIGLISQGMPNLLARIVVALLLIAGVGLLGAAIFPTDLPGAPYTRAGDIHEKSFLINVSSLLLATVAFALGYSRDSRWCPHTRVLAMLSVATCLAFIVQFLTLHKGAPYGLANRLFALTLLTWLTFVAFGMRAITSR